MHFCIPVILESPTSLPPNSPDKILEVPDIEVPKTARSPASRGMYFVCALLYFICKYHHRELCTCILLLALPFSSCNSSGASPPDTQKLIDDEPGVADKEKDNQKSDSGRRQLETTTEGKVQGKATLKRFLKVMVDPNSI